MRGGSIPQVLSPVWHTRSLGFFCTQIRDCMTYQCLLLRVKGARNKYEISSHPTPVSIYNLSFLTSNSATPDDHWCALLLGHLLSQSLPFWFDAGNSRWFSFCPVSLLTGLRLLWQTVDAASPWPLLILGGRFSKKTNVLVAIKVSSPKSRTQMCRWRGRIKQLGTWFSMVSSKQDKANSLQTVSSGTEILRVGNTFSPHSNHIPKVILLKILIAVCSELMFKKSTVSKLSQH